METVLKIQTMLASAGHGSKRDVRVKGRQFSLGMGKVLLMMDVKQNAIEGWHGYQVLRLVPSTPASLVAKSMLEMVK